LRRVFSFGGPAINATSPPPAGTAPPWEAPAPVLLNTWKHHAGALRRCIRAAAAGGAAGLDDLARGLVVVGGELMDLYTGRLTPAEIGAKVLARLDAEGRRPLPAYHEWVKAEDGYRLLTFPEDGSRWVLRLGDEAGLYVHVHPARWAPQTCRVRANVLKTAVMVLAHVAAHGGDPTERARVNEVRRDYLGLAPVGRELTGEGGLGGVIDLLRAEAG
jgi:hypothetical protein